MADLNSTHAWPTRVGAFSNRIAGAARAFAHAFTISLFPRTEAEARIVDRQLDIMRANTRLIPYAIPCAGLVGALAVSKWVSMPLLATWLALLFVAGAAHEIAARHFEAHRSVGAFDVRRRAITMTSLCFVYLLVWSSFGVWAWAADIAVSHYLVAFVLGCTLAAACTMGSAHTASVVGVAAPAAALMVARPLLADALDPMTGICVVYVVLMAAFARSTHVTTTRALQLEDDRAELIESLRRARDESDSARRRAEEANLAKSEFLANMSHELRTPLNAIIGFSDIIRTRAFGPSRDKYVEYAGFINESGTHLLALISDMLELAKIETGRKTLHEETIDLSEAIAAAVSGVRGVARDREVTVEIGRGPAPFIKADRHALLHVLHQLLSNAVKFTRPQGHVQIAAHVTDTGEAAIVVLDDGVGIGSEEQSHVFDRFGRGQHDIARANIGPGLGLPIVKGLIELHGGRVGLVSAPGEGTRVTVTFPTERTIAPEPVRVAG